MDGDIHKASNPRMTQIGADRSRNPAIRIFRVFGGKKEYLPYRPALIPDMVAAKSTDFQLLPDDDRVLHRAVTFY